MKRTQTNKDAAYLRQKMELYEGFLYGYLPQLSSLSFITRLNLFDMFGRAGLDRLGSLGTPFLIFHALRKQRQHQIRKKRSTKPFTFSLISCKPASPATVAMEKLQQENAISSSCKLIEASGPFPESIRKLARLLQQQPASEKNLLFLDPLDLPQFSLQEVKLLAEKKVEILLCLPLTALFELHTKGEKALAPKEVKDLKQEIDQLFPEEHPWWQTTEPADFKAFLKEALRMEDRFYTAVAAGGPGLSEAAVFALTADAFMMERILLALPSSPVQAPPATGAQLPLFNAPPKQEEVSFDKGPILDILKEERDNQQLYALGLQAGILPAQLHAGLTALLAEGAIELLDEKKKQTADLAQNCISHTAFKAPKPLCYFRLGCV